MAGVLIERAFGHAASLLIGRERESGRPRPREHGRIGHRELVVERLGIDPLEALDHPQIRPGRPPARRPPVVGLVGEAGRLDHERITFPAAAGFAHPLGEVRSRPAVQRNHANVVEHLGGDRDVVRCLHDQVVVVVARPVRNRHAVGQTAFARVEIDIAVARPGAVVPRVPAGERPPFGRIRNPAIGRIDDERAAAVRNDRRRGIEPDLVIGARISLRSLRLAGGPAARSRFEGVGLFPGEHRLVGKFARPLERRNGGPGPRPLQIRRPPGRAKGRRIRAGRRRLPGKRSPGERDDSDCNGKPARDERALAHDFIPSELQTFCPSNLLSFCPFAFCPLLSVLLPFCNRTITFCNPAILQFCNAVRV